MVCVELVSVHDGSLCLWSVLSGHDTAEPAESSSALETCLPSTASLTASHSALHVRQTCYYAALMSGTCCLKSASCYSCKCTGSYRIGQ